MLNGEFKKGCYFMRLEVEGVVAAFQPLLELQRLRLPGKLLLVGGRHACQRGLSP